MGDDDTVDGGTPIAGRPSRGQIRGFDWSRLPPGTERGRFRAPSGELATAVWGPDGGTPVLCLPGITGSKEDFSLIGPLLAGAGYRVMAVDLAGQYESYRAGPAPGGRWDLALHVRDAEALLAAVGPAHVVGYSFAGLVAGQLLVRRRASVRSLTLLSTPPQPGNSLAAMRIVGPLARVAGPRAAAAIMLWGVRWNLNRVPRGRYRLVRRRLRYTRASSVADAMDVMMHVPDIEDELRSAGVPVLVVAGHGDLWARWRHEAFASRIRARVRVYRAGHSPLETMPVELATDLLDFLAPTPGPTTT